MSKINSDYDVELSFKSAMAQEGIETAEKLVLDGAIHRFHVKGDSCRSKNGYYVVFPGQTNGVFGSWKLGIKKNWFLEGHKPLTPSERRDQWQKIKIQQAEVLKERKAAQTIATIEARRRWEAASSANDDHPYLITKKVKSHGLRIEKGNLVVPLHNFKGEIQSLQFIQPDGFKTFLKGAAMKGFFFTIGEIQHRFCLAEGYATAATIFEVMEIPTIACLSADNLLSVAIESRNKFPRASITICADDDFNLTINKGVLAAQVAAQRIGARVAYPRKKL